ncbi:MAG: cyanophycin synthetase, partial [Betaproteobacteria bacterium]|nr:cyanophycin synthetase [Betaproteobacteria bacterium]
MDISRIRALRGPNLWTRQTAIEAIVTLGPDEQHLDNLPGFEARLRTRFPALGPIEASINDRQVSLAHALQAATLALQSQAGCPVTFGRTVHAVQDNIYQVVVEYSEEAVGRLAMSLAEQLC